MCRSSFPMVNITDVSSVSVLCSIIFLYCWKLQMSWRFNFYANGYGARKIVLITICSYVDLFESRKQYILLGYAHQHMRRECCILNKCNLCVLQKECKAENQSPAILPWKSFCLLCYYFILDASSSLLDDILLGLQDWLCPLHTIFHAQSKGKGISRQNAIACISMGAIFHRTSIVPN